MSLRMKAIREYLNMDKPIKKEKPTKSHSARKTIAPKPILSYFQLEVDHQHDGPCIDYQRKKGCLKCDALYAFYLSIENSTALTRKTIKEFQDSKYSPNQSCSTKSKKGDHKHDQEYQEYMKLFPETEEDYNIIDESTTLKVEKHTSDDEKDYSGSEEEDEDEPILSEDENSFIETKLKSKIEDLRSQIEDYKKEINIIEIDDLKEQIKDYKNQIETMKNKVIDLDTEKQNLDQLTIDQQQDIIKKQALEIKENGFTENALNQALDAYSNLRNDCKKLIIKYEKPNLTNFIKRYPEELSFTDN